MSDSEPERSTGDSDSPSKVGNKCRICLTENGEQNVCKPWPEPWKGMGPTIASDIFKLTKIIIFQHNPNKFICSDCCTTLQHVCKFVNTVRLSDLKLKNSYRKHILEKKNENSQANEHHQIIEVISGNEDNIQEAERKDSESSQDGDSDDGDDDDSDEFDDDLIKAYSEITKQNIKRLNKQADEQKQPKHNIHTQQQKQQYKEKEEEQQIKKKEFYFNKQKRNMCIQEQLAEESICTQEKQTMCIPEPQPEPNMCILEQQPEQNLCGEEQPIQIKQEKEEPQQDLNQNTKEWPQPIQLDKSVANVIFDSTIEVKQEVLSEDEYEESDHLVAVKSEPSGYLEGNIQIVNCNGSVPFSSPEKVSDREDFMKEVGLKRVIKSEPRSPEASYLEEEHTTLRSAHLENVRFYSDLQYLDPCIKEEPWSDEEETDLSLDCQLCAKELSCLSGLRAHVIAQHSYKSVGVKKMASKQPKPTKFACLICGKAFSTKTDQMVHAIGHSACVCFGCGRGFSSFSELAQHRPACRGPGDGNNRQNTRLIDINDGTDRITNEKDKKKNDINQDHVKEDDNEKNINKESERDFKKEDEKSEDNKKDNNKVETKIKDENEETVQNNNKKQDYDSGNQQESTNNDAKTQDNIKHYVEIEINIKKNEETIDIEREQENENKRNEREQEDTNKRDDGKEDITTDNKINEENKYDVHVEIIQEPSDDEMNEKTNKKRESGEQMKPNEEAKRPKLKVPSCPESCFFKCTQHFTIEESLAIRSQFTPLRRQARWEFFLEHTVRRNVRNRSKEDSRRRRRRYEYYFNKIDKRVRVCKIFFCNVLNISSPTISELYRKCDSGLVTFNELNTKKLEILENPSLRLSCKKISQVEKHIQSIVSTYDSTNKLNADRMYAMYAEATFQPVSIEIYRRVYEILIKTASEKFETDCKLKRRKRKLQADKAQGEKDIRRNKTVNKDSVIDSDSIKVEINDSVIDSDSIKVEINDSEVSVKEEVMSSDEGVQYLDDNILASNLEKNN